MFRIAQGGQGKYRNFRCHCQLNAIFSIVIEHENIAFLNFVINLDLINRESV
jgi:hypothetical protein